MKVSMFILPFLLIFFSQLTAQEYLESSPYQLFLQNSNDTKSVKFGNISTNRTVLRSFGIQNNSANSINISIDSSYNDKNFQVILYEECLDLEPESSCDVKVVFSPYTTQEGFFEENLTLNIFQNNIKTPFKLTLQSLVSTNSSDPVISISDPYIGIYLDDEDEEIGDEKIFISNNGGGDLYILETELSAKNAISIAEENGCINKLLQPLEYCTLIINYDRSLSEIEENILIITSDDPNTPFIAIEIYADYWSNDFYVEEEGCFIATAAYGSYFEPNVKILRNFRDEMLLQSELGIWFVHTYYRLSPPIANYIAQNEVLKSLTRVVLTPIVYFVKYPLLMLLFPFLWLVFLLFKPKSIQRMH